MAKQNFSSQKRRFERITAELEVRFFFGNIFYSGVVTNLSENGMFIRTKISSSLEAVFSIIIHPEKKLLHVLAKVKRLQKTNGCDGIGVEIINPSQYYLELINSLKSVLQT